MKRAHNVMMAVALIVALVLAASIGVAVVRSGGAGGHSHGAGGHGGEGGSGKPVPPADKHPAPGGAAHTH